MVCVFYDLTAITGHACAVLPHWVRRVHRSSPAKIIPPLPRALLECTGTQNAHHHHRRVRYTLGAPRDLAAGQRLPRRTSSTWRPSQHLPSNKVFHHPAAYPLVPTTQETCKPDLGWTLQARSGASMYVCVPVRHRLDALGRLSSRVP